MYPSRFLAMPFIIGGIILILLAFKTQAYVIYMLIPAIALMGIYVLHPQIDWWWFNKFPPRLDKKGQAFLARFMPFYQKLDELEKDKLHQRIALIELATDFSSMAEVDLPNDAMVAFAATQAQLTFGLEEYLIKGYEKVIYYPGAFPSPKYPEHFHLSENFEEETTNGFIFSLQYALQAFLNPQQYYNIVLHEQAQVFIKNHPDWAWPQLNDQTWEELEKISSFPTEHLKNTINRPDFELLPAAITYFFSFPEKFEQALPTLYITFQELFRTKAGK